MAFDDISLSERDLVFRLLEAHTSGKYSPEFYVAGVGKDWSIKLEGVNGNEHKELRGFTESDLLMLETKRYLTPNPQIAEDVLSLAPKAFEQFHLSQAAATLRSSGVQKSSRADVQNNENIIDIFISHSSQDEKLAKELAEFLNIVFKTDKIRCTSVPGYRLEPGATVEETLRKEIHESKVFIGLITPASLTSHYVLFELGARWGAQLDLIPVLASGADSRDLREPLKNRNPVRCDARAEIRDLINKIATVLGAEPYYVAVHEKLVDALIKKAKVGKERKQKQRDAESNLEENPRSESSGTVEKLEDNLNLIQEALDFVDQLTESDLTSSDGRIQATGTFRSSDTYSFPVRGAMRAFSVSEKRLDDLKRHIRELLEHEEWGTKAAIGVDLLSFLSITRPGHPFNNFDPEVDRIFKEIDVQLGVVCRKLSLHFPGTRFGDDNHYSSEYWTREEFFQAKNILRAAKSV
jgi:hypothetical protein